MYDTNTEVTEVEAGSEDKPNKTHMELYDWIQCIVTALVCGVLIFVFIGRTIGVDGYSMVQTLQNNDRVIMSNLFYTPTNGDIVVFRSPAEKFNGVPLVKRVIATAGETVDIKFDTGEVFVNGVLQYEPYIHTMTTSSYDFTGAVTIPSGYVFVLGDNRASSTDSRDKQVGLVDTRYILGKVLFILIPGADDVGHRDWNRFGVTG
jgi:signal peptidase I